jgi:hypothetical protein
MILLDEWTTIPIELQPYVAEFLKRTIIPSPLMCLKVGSLLYGSSFSVLKEHVGRIGFEFGATIVRAIDLDDYYTSQRDLAAATDAFADLLWRHLRAQLPQSQYLQDQHSIAGPADLKGRLFKDSDCFIRLIEAAAGVTRDFFSIFTIAYFRAAVARTPTIEVQAIRDATRISFEADKLPNLSSVQEAVLEVIADQLNAHESRLLFLLDRRMSGHDIIEALLDARAIHIIKRQYRSKQLPGQYVLYGLDYGAAITLRESLTVTPDSDSYKTTRNQALPLLLDPAVMGGLPSGNT